MNDDDVKYIVNELNSRRGEKVMYSGGFGNDEPEPAILHGAGFDYEKNDILIDVVCLDGHIHWGYIYQIKFMRLYSLSNFTGNATELYIALNTMEEFDDPIVILKKYAEYLNPKTIEYYEKGK